MKDKTWHQYDPAGEHVPMSRWGRDHWSTLAYAEARAVDYSGRIDNRHMRCHARRHSAFAHGQDGSQYPTRLKGGTKKEEHDDWDCLKDLAAAGLLTLEWRQRDGGVIGGSEARVKLTDKGYASAAALRRHKADGGNYASFTFESDGGSQT